MKQLKKETNHLIMFFSYLLAFGLSIVLFVTYLWSYFFNNYTFTININSFGEANVELVILFLVLTFLIYGLFINCRNVKHNLTKNRYWNKNIRIFFEGNVEPTIYMSKKNKIPKKRKELN